MTKISIIIPVLNESETISDLINHLLNNSSNKNISEIIVVDGGSTDGSKEIVSRKMSGRAQSRPNKDLSSALEETKIILLNSKRGRAKQMNIGAKQATGNILYFLHADSFPPPRFDQLIINEVEKGNQAGCFKMKFDSKHWWLQLASWLTQFSWKACRGGDQSQFITKQLFEDLNGFDETYSVYEDYDLIKKLYAKKQFIVIQKWLTTSARRYHSNGIWKLQFHKKFFGASAEELHQYYLKNIS